MNAMQSAVLAILAATISVPVSAGTSSGNAVTKVHTALERQDGDAMLFLPPQSIAPSEVAVVFAHPEDNAFTNQIGPQLASRGYTVLGVNPRISGGARPDTAAPLLSAAIARLRKLPGVKKVVILGHSGGGELAAFYAAVSEAGPSWCARSEVIYPCDSASLESLEPVDGVILLDSTLGPFHRANAIDPATSDDGTLDPTLDMFSPANGFDPASGTASYSQDFIDRFDSGQAARANHLTDLALERLAAIENGKGTFANDEPLLIRGMGARALGTRLYQPDLNLVSHTREPHEFVHLDGTHTTEIIVSRRNPSGAASAAGRDDLGGMNQLTTVRSFLSSTAVRFEPGFAFEEDGISGVDWHSAMTSVPANAEAITRPALVMVMGCHYLVVPGEIAFDHLASRDKTMIGIEGSTHVFTPCNKDTPDPAPNVFDAIAAWLADDGRF